MTDQRERRIDNELVAIFLRDQETPAQWEALANQLAEVIADQTTRSTADDQILALFHMRHGHEQFYLSLRSVPGYASVVAAVWFTNWFMGGWIASEKFCDTTARLLASGKLPHVGTAGGVQIELAKVSARGVRALSAGDQQAALQQTVEALDTTIVILRKMRRSKKVLRPVLDWREHAVDLLNPV